jgi:hypothetical protein
MLDGIHIATLAASASGQWIPEMDSREEIATY